MEIISVRVGSPSQTPSVNIENPSQVNATLKNVNIQTGGTAKNAVLYDPQDLTDAQKQQARENINAAEKNEIPTKTSDLTNDSGFITKAVNDLANYYLKSETYSKAELDNKISAIPKFSIEVVGSLPISNISDTTVYLVASGNEQDNLYTEYIYVNGAWEYLGKQTVDLTGYVKRTELSSYYTKDEITSLLETIRNSIPTKTSELTDDIGYAKQEDVDNLSEEIADEVTAREQAVASLNARLGQQTVLFAEGATQEEAEAWLETNGDKTKVYFMPDDTFWWYSKTTEVVESGGGFTNLIDGTDGYIKEGYRYSASSAAFKAYTAIEGFASIVIPVPTSGNLTIRVRGMVYKAAYPTIYGGTTNSAFTNCFNDKTTTDTYDDNGDWIFTLSNTAGVPYIVTSGALTGNASDVIATVNEEIVEGGTTTVVVEKWVSTGHGLIATDYDEVIATLNAIVTAHTEEINALKTGVGTTLTDDEKLTAIKNWDSPIYDAHIPVFELSAEKQAMTNATNTPANIYAKYDALMAKHPRYITKTDLGLCSDGVNHVYRYDFKEPEPLHESDKEWSETKTKAIIVTGIHFEWAGIYAMYNALEEIAENPALRNFRRNTHLIVVPVVNPFATIASNYTSANLGVQNANGVEIHRNFEVDWVASTAGTAHYGGAEPLSEVETQYIDNIMKNNTDASLFLSCHNCGVDTFWGTGFIWASTATKYMCNMGYRVVDKMSDAWMDKYGDILSVGIEEYKTDLLEDGDTRLGWAGLSASAGTEAKQATKYGIQGTNVEICNPFQIHGTKANPEPSMSSFTMSRGAETYINFLLTACGTYDYKDKAEYYK